MRPSFTVFAFLTAVASCGQAFKSGASSSLPPITTGIAPRDSVRGTIVLTGVAPAYIVTLVTKDGPNRSLTGPVSRVILEQLDGVNVMAFGARSHDADTAFVMDSFSVRGVAGHPARDGILRRTPSGDFLEVANGRRLAIAHLSAAVTSADGKRIWVAGPMEDPVGMGTLDPDRPSGRRRATPVAHP